MTSNLFRTEGQFLLMRDEQDRFEAVLVPLLDAACNLARWLTKDEHGTEDVVQEAYLRAARYFAGFRGSDGRGWFLAIVRRAAFDWLEKRRHNTSLSYDDELHGLDSKSSNPAYIAIRQSDVAVVQQAIEELPTLLREVIVLRELEGLSYQQIATVTSAPIGTVMSRLSRARMLLQVRLAGEEGEIKE